MTLRSIQTNTMLKLPDTELTDNANDSEKDVRRYVVLVVDLSIVGHRNLFEVSVELSIVSLQLIEVLLEVRIRLR